MVAMVSTISMVQFGGMFDALLLTLAILAMISTWKSRTKEDKLVRGLRRLQTHFTDRFSKKRPQDHHAIGDTYGGVDSCTRVKTLQRLFGALSIDHGIEKFLDGSFPRQEDQEVARDVAQKIQRAIAALHPDVTAEGFPLSRLVGGEDAAHLPEIAVNVTLDEEQFVNRFDDGKHGFRKQGGSRSGASPLTRACVSLLGRHLLYKGVVRRYSKKLQGKEAFLRVFRDDLTVVVHVNNVIPARTSTLLAELECKFPGGAKLAFLVFRWTRDRGITFEAKGHLGQYAWSVLVLRFLKSRSREAMRSASSVPSLFRDFVRYYSEGSNGRLLFEEHYAKRGSPYIQDPCISSNNLAASMSPAAVSRVLEEFTRAHRLLDDDESTLVQLLEHWQSATTATGANIRGEAELPQKSKGALK
eukprot:TRINITY_DN75982_c0_g1_i1.p1 TRINITY_DN75982_c0_g1~~TRINITY_DN75982_c0_g1_i1.p1  ORF type:complete len:442 (-),score=40.21 TRINITY_DN75982_c0_g1_i1:231-1472(-)